jgi:hypothetical protein
VAAVSPIPSVLKDIMPIFQHSAALFALEIALLANFHQLTALLVVQLLPLPISSIIPAQQRVPQAYTMPQILVALQFAFLAAVLAQLASTPLTVSLAFPVICYQVDFVAPLAQ